MISVMTELSEQDHSCNGAYRQEGVFYEYWPLLTRGQEGFNCAKFFSTRVHLVRIG